MISIWAHFGLLPAYTLGISLIRDTFPCRVWLEMMCMLGSYFCSDFTSSSDILTFGGILIQIINAFLFKDTHYRRHVASTFRAKTILKVSTINWYRGVSQKCRIGQVQVNPRHIVLIKSF